MYELEQQKRKKLQQIEDQRETMRSKKEENDKRLSDLETA